MLSLRVKTQMFSTAPEGDREFCNGMPCSQFAGWLRAHLRPKGYDCDEVIQEDYGWGFWISKSSLFGWQSPLQSETWVRLTVSRNGV